MSKLATILEMIRIMRSGENLGDAGVLKLTVFGRRDPPGPHDDAVRGFAEQNFRPLDPAALARMPAGSFGRAYADFMGRNGLSPLNFSARSHPFFERYPVSIRYLRVHDLVHVLIGLEPDYPGEVGVYAFVGAQGYNRTLNRAARLARFVGRLLFPLRRRIREAERIGREAARDARILIAEPLEEMLERPLVEVRRALGLPERPGEPVDQSGG